MVQCYQGCKVIWDGGGSDQRPNRPRHLRGVVEGTGVQVQASSPRRCHVHLEGTRPAALGRRTAAHDSTRDSCSAIRERRRPCVSA